MSDRSSIESTAENTGERYAFGKPMSNKYAFGKTNTVGQRAENVVRAERDINQPDHVEAEARITTILQTQAARISNILDDTRESLKEVYSKRMKEEVYAEYGKVAAAHEEKVKAELIEKLTPEIKALLKAQYAIQAKDEAAAESLRLRAALKTQIEFRLIEELRPDVIAKLRLELTEPVKEELRQKLAAELQDDEYDGHGNDHSEFQDGEHQNRQQNQHRRDGHCDDHSEFQDDEFDDKEEHRSHQHDHRNGHLEYQDGENHDKEDHQNRRHDQRYDSSGYLEEDENYQTRQQDQHSGDCHFDDHRHSPKQINRDEQPIDDSSAFHESENLLFPAEQGNAVQQEAPPSSTLRGVKRSRLEQEYDEDDFHGRSPKRARISGHRAEERLHTFGHAVEEESISSNQAEEENDDDCDTTDQASETHESKENMPPSSAYHGMKRSRFEEESDEEDTRGRSPKRARISSYGGEEEDEWRGEHAEEEEGARCFDDAGESEKEFSSPRGSKENPINLDDSSSEDEEILEPASHWNPFLGNRGKRMQKFTSQHNWSVRARRATGQFAHTKSEGTRELEESGW